MPDITVSGPFYYQDDPVTNPNGKTYIITHNRESSFKLVLYNYASEFPTLEGKPMSNQGAYNCVNMTMLVGKKCIALGKILVGQNLSTSSVNRTGDILYVTLVAGEDYLLCSIETVPPAVCVPLYVVYAPIYTVDNNLYGLMYCGLVAYIPNNSTKQYILSYKDNLNTKGKTVPSSTTYGIGLKLLNRYAYPSFDISLPCTKENYSSVLTINPPYYIRNYYGSRYTPNGENTRSMNTEFHGRECFLVMCFEQEPSYPQGSILTLDDKDYYVCKEKSAYSESGYTVYHLFQL